MLIAVQAHPQRIEPPQPHPAVMIDLAHPQLTGRHGHDLVGTGVTVVDAKRPVDQQHVEAEEAEYRPGARHQEHHAGHEAHAAQHQHEDQETGGAERAMRGQHGRKDRGVVLARGGWAVVALHGAEYRECMARGTPSKAAARKGKSGTPKVRRAKALPKPKAAAGKASVRASLKKARAGKAAGVKGPGKRAAADRKALAGATPPWTSAEIEEAFRRFQAAEPERKGELLHVNPYTLLVAVVLSAQATDAGVNKATPALFAAANTPAKMVALGEAKVRDFIKTIGLFRTKAHNVIALSQLLIEKHGGEVPPSREALEALPGVGRKTANVVLNMAFGEPTIAVDTHIFRIGNRTGLATGKTPFEVEMKLNEVVPPKYRLHAHHWLILHGRYVCLARRPLCERCVIADLCKWPGKTVVAGAA